MMNPIRWTDVVGALGKLVALLVVCGVPFWFFMVTLAAHGWR